MFLRRLFNHFISIATILILSQLCLPSEGYCGNTCSTAWNTTFGEWEYGTFIPDEDNYWKFTVPDNGDIKLIFENDLPNSCVLVWILYQNGGNCSAALKNDYLNIGETDSTEMIPVTPGTYKLWFGNSGGALDPDSNSYYRFKVKYYEGCQPPSKPIGPVPNDGSTNRSISQSVSWSNGGSATSYDVYFGTNPLPGSGESKGNQTGTTYVPGTLQYNTWYYWRIDGVNSCGTEQGDVWSFKTKNRCPELSNESYSPDRDGNPTDDYSFYVTYQDPDNDSPNRARVYINGTYYNMTNWTGQPYGGGYKYGPINLAVGQTTYYFSFRDSNGCSVRYPETGEFNGPNINNDPQLSLEDGFLTPSTGSTETTFTYKVKYYDPDGHNPSVIQVKIDNNASAYGMAFESGSTSNGIYKCNINGSTLGVGDHGFQFYCEDGHTGDATLCADGDVDISGPTVVEAEPNLTLNDVDSSPRNAGPGQTIHVTGVVRNDGNVQIEPANHQIFINWWSDGIEFVDSSIPVATFPSPTLDAGDDHPFDIEVVIPEDDLPPGNNYFAVVEVDPNNLIYETNETLGDNNRFTPIIGYLDKLGLKSQSSYSGDPVNTALGNFTYAKSDLNIPGRGINLDFSRHYNSQGSTEDLSKTPIGISWSHSYNIYIEKVIQSDELLVVFGDGKNHMYTPDGSGGYNSPEGIHDTLEENPDGTYTLTRKTRVKYHFNVLSNDIGRISSIEDRNGNTISFSYTNDKLITITDTVGRQVTLSYDTFHGTEFVSSIQGPVRPAVTYDYDEQGNLTSVTDPRGHTTTYYYSITHEYKHLLTRINNNRQLDELINYYGDKDGNENTSSNFYGYLVVRQRDADSNDTYYSYDLANRVTTITGPDTLTTAHHYDEQYRFIREDDPKGNYVEFNYDATGNMDWVRDKRGNITSYTYDAMGNVLTKTDPPVAPATTGIVTKIEYTPLNDPEKRTVDYGGLNLEWIYVYDNGNLESETDPEGNQTTYTYNAYGQVQTVEDPNNNITTSFYEDTHMNLTKVVGPLPSSCETIYGYDDLGRKLTAENALNNTTTFHYDNNDNLEWVEDPEGNRTVNVYDANNNIEKMTNPRLYATYYIYDDKDRLTDVNAPHGETTHTDYDAYDRKMKVVDRWGNETKFTYDDVGSLETVTDADNNVITYNYDENGNKKEMIDQNTNLWKWVYDEKNRLVSEANPYDYLTTYEYDNANRITSVTDPEGRETRFEYYKTGQIKKVIDAEDGETLCIYDGNGNRLTEQDARGFPITYEYDELNRLEKIIDRNLNETVFEYDCMNLIHKTDGNKVTTEYSIYDKNNRLKIKTYPGSNTVSYTYDKNGNLETIIDSLGTTTYTYDQLDRLLSVEDPYGKTVSYEYDPAVNKRTVVYPDTKEVVYEYDNLNRLWKVSDWLGYTTTYAYNNRSKLAGITNTAGTHVDYTYDNAGRLLTAMDQTSGGGTISSFSYVLDKVGNRKSAKMDIPLAPVFDNEIASAGFDQESQITDRGAASFGFDDAGRQTGKIEDIVTTNYTFNLEDRLTGVSDGTDTWQYQYNGAGDRLAKVVNSTETRYVLDLNGDMSKVLCETDAAGAITDYYVYGAGLLYKITSSGDRYHYHFDPIGSTLALTDATETITDKYAYDSFGEMVSHTGSTENAFRYVGQYGVMDEDNGLLFMRARFYDPETKRFLSRDPVKGDVRGTQTLDSYTYGKNNPISWTDPKGLWHWTPENQKERNENFDEFWGAVLKFDRWLKKRTTSETDRETSKREQEKLDDYLRCKDCPQYLNSDGTVNNEVYLNRMIEAEVSAIPRMIPTSKIFHMKTSPNSPAWQKALISLGNAIIDMYDVAVNELTRENNKSDGKSNAITGGVTYNSRNTTKSTSGSASVGVSIRSDRSPAEKTKSQIIKELSVAFKVSPKTIISILNNQ